MNTCIYYAEKWSPYENDKYYYYNVYFVRQSQLIMEKMFIPQINIEIGNRFRTKEELEKADIQQILENLKMYYKNKEGK